MTVDDAPARAAIVRDLDVTRFVEAGAGTGKTTALVGRISELILSGRARLAEVAAITFTEAAAAELRERIADALEAAALAGGLPERVDRAHDALGEIDGAAISTLHGFARRVLAEHPFEAGLPPSIEVLDEIRSGVAFEERWVEFLDALLEGPRQEGLLRLLACGVTLNALKELARQGNANWDLLVDRPVTPSALLPVRVGDVVAAVGRALELEGLCTDDEDRLLGVLGAARTWAARLVEATGDLEALGALVDAPSMRVSHTGRQDHWSGRIAEVRQRVEEVAAARDRALEAAARPALTTLVAEIGDLTLGAAEARRREGRLEYHDLLVMALQLVRGDGEVRAQLAQRYRYLLIDEYQDTDPIQAELAVRIAAIGDPSAADDWRDLEIEPGRLFFVGDPKQSIYRFRRADVSLFLETRDRLVPEPLRLSRNRRSVPGVIEWINALFGELIGAGEHRRQPTYEPLVAHRAAHTGGPLGPPVHLLGGPAGEGERLGDVRAREMTEIAATVSRICAEEWPVGDEGRPATLADVAILVPTRTVVADLQDALDEAQVPYRLETSSLVYASSEVSDLLAVLRAVDDPTDEVAVVAALRSTVFGCGDDELFEFRDAGGVWDYRRRAPERLDPDHAVAAGQRALAVLHEERQWHDAGRLVERVLAERRMLALALGAARPRESWRRLRFVADQARRYSDAFGGDLRGYLAWAEMQAAEDKRVAEPVVPESDHDALRIMTVHAAKGLEFPIVVLTGLNVVPRADSGPRLLFGPGGPEVSVGVVATPGFAARAAAEEEMERFEQLRLLYVALTRAEDHLVVSVHHRPGDGTHAETVRRVCAGFEDLWSAPGPDGPASPPRADAPVPAADPGDTPEARREWTAARRDLLARAAVPRSIPATSVATLARALSDGGAEWGQGPAAEEASGETPGWRRGRAGTAVGRAVHAVLQTIDLVSGEGLADLARAQAVAEGVPGEADRVARLVRSALDADELVAARHRRRWRELYLGVPVGRRVLEGFVDLLVDGPDGLTVVDYKTDQAPDDELAAAAARYRMQGAAYALAVERSVGRPVTRCVFLFLRPDGARSVELEDLGAATAELAGLLGAI
ncbi:MAG TPA: UvrD-helicase domain-containing protein [Acidimicrobiales bacterium]|nr:UvrD-helicase domain-containing protein [Acidimicrobiales bacterium]